MSDQSGAIVPLVVQEPSPDLAPGDLCRYRGRVLKVNAVWHRVDEQYTDRFYLELDNSKRPIMVRVR